LIGDLFINMTILISYVSIASQFLRKKDLNEGSSIKVKIIVGMVTGILGITLMLHGLYVSEHTIIDFRNVAIVLTAVHGGALAAIVSGIIIAVFRIAHFGINLSSVWGVFLITIVTISAVYISNIKISKTEKWVYGTLSNMVFSSIVLTFLLRDTVNIFYFLSTYLGATCVLTVIIGYYSNYCLMNNELFRKLQLEANKDFLTGLNNVRSFDDLFNEAMKSAKEKKCNLSLLMIDIDYFKKINDTYGHSEGDRVLQEMGLILARNARSFDIVSRYGGEEFTVLLDCTKAQAIQAAERIRSSVENHKFTLATGHEISVTVSIGIASYPETTEELETLLEQADFALYAAKRTGRNKVWYDNLSFNN
jgi:diguanylate cyclase